MALRRICGSFLKQLQQDWSPYKSRPPPALQSSLDSSEKTFLVFPDAMTPLLFPFQNPSGVEDWQEKCLCRMGASVYSQCYLLARITLAVAMLLPSWAGRTQLLNWFFSGFSKNPLNQLFSMCSSGDTFLSFSKQKLFFIKNIHIIGDDVHLFIWLSHCWFCQKLLSTCLFFSFLMYLNVKGRNRIFHTMISKITLSH